MLRQKGGGGNFHKKDRRTFSINFKFSNFKRESEWVRMREREREREKEKVKSWHLIFGEPQWRPSILPPLFLTQPTLQNEAEGRRKKVWARSVAGTERSKTYLLHKGRSGSFENLNVSRKWMGVTGKSGQGGEGGRGQLFIPPPSLRVRNKFVCKITEWVREGSVGVAKLFCFVSDA